MTRIREAFVQGYSESGGPSPHVLVGNIIGYTAKAAVQTLTVVIVLRMLGVSI